MYEPVLPIRLFLLRQTEPDKFAIAQTLMDHDVDRRTISTEYWDQTVKLITPILQSLRENNINATFEEVCRSVGICEVNSYEIYNVDRKTGYKAVLPLTSLLSHSCQPNCRPIIERKFPYDNRWFATVDIPKGVELTIHYTHLTDPTSIRIKVLKENWYFECTCSRCLDPKDLDSYLEAIKCTQCWEKNQEKEGKGYFRPKGHFREETNAWVCDSCGEVRTNEMNEMLVKQLQDEKDAIGLMNLSDLVTFSKKAEGLLHVNHYILTSVRRWVIPLFCRALRGYNEADVRKSFPPEMYKDKIDMCQKQLKVLDICDPGLSKSRGETIIIYISVFEG